MIVTEIKGGLGNQMFQYACGRSLAVRNNAELQLDVSWFTEQTRSYALEKFNICGNICHNKIIDELREGGKLYRIKNRILHRICRVHEKQGRFHRELLNLRGDIYLQGDWQSERYFVDIAGILRKEFSLKQPLSEHSNRWKHQICQDQNAVSIHIRRGDYVTMAANRVLFRELPISYYEECVSRLQRKFNNISVYVFSNDIPWAKENLKLSVPTHFVNGNDEIHGYEDMYLMSICHHNIIANSTFSWWGAWLNTQEDKMVFAPKHWFNQAGYENEELIPTSWQSILL